MHAPPTARGPVPLETPTFFRPLQTREQGSVKLLCFPGIHGKGAQFRKWPTLFPDSVEVWAFSWPEVVPDNYGLFLSALAEEISPHLSGAFALFGYSLGGIPAFGLAQVLRRTFSLEPSALFLAASVAPNTNPVLQSEVRELLSQALSESLGAAVFESLYGEQKSFWQSHCEACSALPPFRCPLTAFGGELDSLIPSQALESWESYTTGPFSLQMVAGDHRFPFSHTPFLIESIKSQLPSL